MKRRRKRGIPAQRKRAEQEGKLPHSPTPKRPRTKRWYEIVQRIPTDRPVIGAEIGVLYGVTAGLVLKHRPNVTHIMVDPWSAESKDQSYIDSGAHDGVADQAFFDKAYQRAMAAIQPYRDRAAIYRMKSVEAAFRIEDDSLDYVFIDGDHSYEGVRRDIETWLPKVCPGGWIGGHDYNSPRFPGVAQAVHEFFSPTLHVETGIDKTWFVRKP